MNRPLTDILGKMKAAADALAALDAEYRAAAAAYFMECLDERSLDTVQTEGNKRMSVVGKSKPDPVRTGVSAVTGGGLLQNGEQS